MADEAIISADDGDLDTFSEAFFSTESPATGDDDTPAPEEDETSEEENIEAEPVEQDGNDDDDEDDEGEDESDDTPEPEPEAPKKRPVQKRIEELLAKNREAEARERALLARLEALEQESKKEDPKPPQKSTKVDYSDSPTPDDLSEDGKLKYPLGEFDPDFIRDLTVHTIAKENAAMKARNEAEAKEQEENAAREKLASDWQGKLADAEERLPDLREKAENLENTFRGLDPTYGTYLASTIMSMDHGPEVLHYLATNIAEAQKIVASGPMAATIALGRIEAGFIGRKNKQKSNEEPVIDKTPTRAPPPPAQNRGSGGKFMVSDDTDDLDAFESKFFKKK